LLIVGTTLIGSFFLIPAWVQTTTEWAKGARPGKALYTLTASVLLDAMIVVISNLSESWQDWHRDLWIFVLLSTISVSFALLVTTVVLTRRSTGAVKIGSRVLLGINLPSVAAVIHGLGKH
jgi:hypothetical protein